MTDAARLSEITDLLNQWEALVGHTVTVPNWMVDEMANNNTVAGFITSVYDVGRYMLAHTAPGPYNLVWMDAQYQPWAWYGMSVSEYDTKVQALSSTYEQLTGQAAPANDGHGNIIDQALSVNQGSMTGAQFQTFLLSQENIKNQFGWLKYGLDFQQFQQQKLQMRTQFGRDLTDQEAVAQLTYMHAAQGPNVSAAVTPTLTQVEKKAAQTGVGQSVVR